MWSAIYEMTEVVDEARANTISCLPTLSQLISKLCLYHPSSRQGMKHRVEQRVYKKQIATHAFDGLAARCSREKQVGSSSGSSMCNASVCSISIQHHKCHHLDITTPRYCQRPRANVLAGQACFRSRIYHMIPMLVVAQEENNHREKGRLVPYYSIFRAVSPARCRKTHLFFSPSGLFHVQSRAAIGTYDNTCAFPKSKEVQPTVLNATDQITFVASSEASRNSPSLSQRRGLSLK